MSCAGIYDESQLDGLARVCSVITEMGGVPAIQLGQTGRKGSLDTPWEGGYMLPPDHPNGWETVGPSAIPYGGDMPYAPRELTVEEIRRLYAAYAQSAKWAAQVGFKWLEMHYAHGYLGATFFSPLANQRTDQYGGSLENRSRFHREALDAVRAMWPEQFALTMRLASDDFNPDGVQFDDTVTAIGWMKEHGLDLADLSLGFNTDAMQSNPLNDRGFMVERATRVRREVGIPVAASWNLGVPATADAVIKEENWTWSISVDRRSPIRTGPSGLLASWVMRTRSASYLKTRAGGCATSAVIRLRSGCPRPPKPERGRPPPARPSGSRWPT